MYNKVLLTELRGRGAIDERKYIAELTKLLAFMSSWDRQAAIERYEAMFDEARDPDALIEELGTPTKVAVELANGYVSSPPPDAQPEAGNVPSPEAETEPETNAAVEEVPVPPVEEETAEPVPDAGPAPAIEAPPPAGPARGDAAPEAAPPAEPEATEGGANGFVRLLFWLFAIFIGIPVTVLLVCVGVPFLAAGVWIIYTVIRVVPGAFGSFTLLSDTLLLGGAGLALLGIGLFLTWFGLWLSITLCRLWIGKALFSLGERVMRGPAGSGSR